MATAVFDASVVLGWILSPRTQAEKDFCDRIRLRVVERDMTMLVPAVFEIEVAGGLLKARRRKEISLTKFNEGRALVAELPLQVHSFAYSIDQIIELATDYHAQPADAMYLHLAQMHDATVITIDRGMAQACKQSGIECEAFDRMTG